MTAQLVALCIDAVDPPRLARFWSALLGWETAEGANGIGLLAGDDTGFRLRFRPTAAPKSGQNRVHVDLTSRSAADQQRTVATALRLGGTHVDVGQRPEEPHVVLGDPEGNEFCVVEPGNGFLADCGFVGALACDGSRQVGYFRSEALRWPLVWDQDQETAIRSPHGGPKITWGGPPVRPKAGRSRLHLDLAVPTGGDQQREVHRLVTLGASLVDAGPDDEYGAGRVVLTDPDGNEFCLLRPGAATAGP